MEDLLPALAHEGAEQACAQCTDCLQICPGASPKVVPAERRMFGRVRRGDERWLGIHRAAKACWAIDEGVRARSGAGGTVSALLAHGMEHLALDWALVCGRQADKPWRAIPVVCRNAAEISEYAQSTYQLTAHLLGLREPLLSEGESRGAVVGLPCHFQALRAIQALDSPIGERARNRVVFTIEIACSSNTLPSGTEAVLVEDLGLELKDVLFVGYRDGGLEQAPYPGVFSATTRDGRRHDLPLWHVFRKFTQHKTHRCLSCPDWLSGLTDLSVFDGDPNIFVGSLNAGSGYDKHGTVLIRTQVGAEVLESAIRAGAVAARDTELQSGNLGLERKRSRRVFYERSGKTIPDPPIPGFEEPGDYVDDDELLAVPAETLSRWQRTGKIPDEH